MQLSRSASNRVIAGVLGGIAGSFGWRATRLRIVWVLCTLFSAAFPGIILYLVLWYLMPKDTQTTGPWAPARSSRPG
jgi:phage shock protein C